MTTTTRTSGNGKRPLAVIPGPIESEEAEMSLIGSLIFSADELTEIAQFLKPEHFFWVKHRDIYQTIVEMHGRGEAIDNVTVCEALRAADKLQLYGGSSYITELMNITPTWTNAMTYAKLIHKAASRRKIVGAADTIAQLAHSNIELPQVIRGAQEAIDDATNEHDYGELMPIDVAANEALADFEAAYAEPNYVRGLKLGLQTCDNAFAGFDPGWTLSFVMPTNAGKTTLSVQVLQSLVEQTHVMYVPTEMTQARVVKRIATQRLNLPPNVLRTGYVDKETGAAITNEMAAISQWPVEVLESRRPTIDEIEMRARQYKRRLGSAFGAIIVDSASNVGTRGGGKIFDVTRTVMNGLAALCSDLNVLGILTWQSNRESYEGGIGVTSGRGAAEIEHASDVIFTFIDPELAYINQTKAPPPDWLPHAEGWRQVKMVCIKDRESGKTGWQEPYWFVPGKGFVPMTKEGHR